jgi:hypothetical protein
MDEFKLQDVLRATSVLGVAGNRSTGKSNAVLSSLATLRKEYPSVPVFVYGTEYSLRRTLREQGITILESEMDILDLQLKDCVIFIDEFASFFDTSSSSKQGEKLQRFFDRIEHNNVKLIVGTAREGFWNKFACARIQVFLVKEIEYESLVNGTWLKERVQAIASLSDYRLQIPKSSLYVVSNREGLTKRYDIAYNEQFDTKKHNISLFKKDENKYENSCENNRGTKDDAKNETRTQ